jgi:hypothetical protein
MTRTFDGQQYELIGGHPHTRLDGTETRLAVWRSHRAACGEPFEMKTPLRLRRFVPNQRCPQHRRPGVRVKQSGQP